MKALVIPRMVTQKVREDYKRVFEIPLSNPKMDDNRRTIREEDNQQERTSTQAFFIKAGGLPLGNHFHKNKVEIFFVLEGSVEHLLTTDAAGGAVKVTTDISTGSMIVMPPGVAHTFYLSPGSRMICYSSERFDASDLVSFPLPK